MSEVRLIDANALMERFAEMQKVKPDKDGREYACNFLNMGGEPSAEWFTVEDAVENAPTVDAVPVEWWVMLKNSVTETAEQNRGVEENRQWYDCACFVLSMMGVIERRSDGRV